MAILASLPPAMNSNEEGINGNEEAIKEETLDEVNKLISTQINLLRKFLRLTLFLPVELASQKNTCRTSTPAFCRKIR